MGNVSGGASSFSGSSTRSVNTCARQAAFQAGFLRMVCYADVSYVTFSQSPQTVQAHSYS